MDEAFKKMADQFSSMIDEMMGGNLFRSSAPDLWVPAINVYELAERYVVCVDLAGMERERIDVYVEGRTLHVRGVRPKPTVPDGEGRVSVHLMEINSGRFHRKVRLTPDVRVADVKAVYRKGYLWIDLPRERQSVDE